MAACYKCSYNIALLTSSADSKMPTNIERLVSFTGLYDKTTPVDWKTTPIQNCTLTGNKNILVYSLIYCYVLKNLFNKTQSL